MEDGNLSVLEAMKSQKEWAKAVAFDSEGKVIAATVKPLDGEIVYVIYYSVALHTQGSQLISIFLVHI